MKLFQCQKCGQLLYFENTRCESCGMTLGYLPSSQTLSALKPKGDNLWEPLADRGRTYRFCSNAGLEVCNWLVASEDNAPFCLACQLNRMIPPLENPQQRQLWWLLEEVKHRLVYSLLRFRLPLLSKVQDAENGLAFDFLTGTGPGGHETSNVVTGHAGGVITIDTAEADPAERERRRTHLDEPYRTLPGHFRHEIGHYYWNRLFQDETRLQQFRERFGDERKDYGQAIEAHYASGPPADWKASFVTAYASSHPWEDWAETWAHYFHIIDTMETAAAFGIAPRKGVQNPIRRGLKTRLRFRPDSDPYEESDFDRIVDRWLPLTYAVNSLNRSMGLPDLYPFVLSPPAVEKLRFVHELIRGVRS